MGEFSPDGARLVYAERTPEAGWDIWTLPLDTSNPEQPTHGRPAVFLRSAANELYPRFSPDGHWIAYTWDASGRFAVYVRPAVNDASGGGPTWQVSTGLGVYPVWSRDGRQLFYAVPDSAGSNISFSPTCQV